MHQNMYKSQSGIRLQLSTLPLFAITHPCISLHVVNGIVHILQSNQCYILLAVYMFVADQPGLIALCTAWYALSRIHHSSCVKAVKS
ncbi:hypothetical protein BGZ60DRAFT_72173 [Tricladium varicosporioides]|nr:hypothetical protein BGZ60DRAFT_72173 [Hymenoscyphus varicosporioides]